MIVQVRPRGSASTVTLDDGSTFRCSREFARRSRLGRGQAIDDAILERLRQSAEDDLALSLADRLNRQQRFSQRQMAARLIRDGIDPATATRVFEQLSERGELDDRAVALSLARRELERAAGRGEQWEWRAFRQRLAGRLALRGFAGPDINAALRAAWAEVHPEALAETVAQDQCRAYSVDQRSAVGGLRNLDPEA